MKRAAGTNEPTISAYPDARFTRLSWPQSSGASIIAACPTAMRPAVDFAVFRRAAISRQPGAHAAE